MQRALALRARLFTIIASGATVATLSSCDRAGTTPVAPNPTPAPPPTGEPTAEAPEPTAPPDPSVEPTSPVPEPTSSASPAPTPVASHPPPHPSRTCAKPVRQCHQPNAAQLAGQGPPSPGEYDKNGCLSGDRFSGHCQGFYAQKGPTFDGKQCCYIGCTGPAAPCGRPVLVAGMPRIATTRARDDWHVDFAALELRARGLPAKLRGELARAWQEDGLLEHASVAAFSRFVLELMGMGAPANLVAEAVAAASDEIEHAKLCFGMGRAFGSAAAGPGRFDLTGVTPRSSLREVVASAVEEACCAETAGALLAARQLELADDPSVKSALARISEDEARHAELGWSFVTWALAFDAGLLPIVRDAFERGIAKLRAITGNEIDPRAEEYGRLDPEQTRRVIESAIEQLIRPSSAQLLQLESEHVGATALG
jgi:hypothetical protein